MNIRPFNRAARVLLATGIAVAAFAGIAQPAQADTCSSNPTINRSASKGIFYEHESSTVTVSLSAKPCSEVKVLLKTADQTAHALQDDVPVAKTFTFAKNTAELSQQVSIHGWNDAVQEGEKSFTVNLSNATGGATIAMPTMTLIVNGVEPQ